MLGLIRPVRTRQPRLIRAAGGAVAPGGPHPTRSVSVQVTANGAFGVTVAATPSISVQIKPQGAFGIRIQ